MQINFSNQQPQFFMVTCPQLCTVTVFLSSNLSDKDSKAWNLFPEDIFNFQVDQKHFKRLFENRNPTIGIN